MADTPELEELEFDGDLPDGWGKLQTRDDVVQATGTLNRFLDEVDAGDVPPDERIAEASKAVDRMTLTLLDLIG